MLGLAWKNCAVSGRRSFLNGTSSKDSIATAFCCINDQKSVLFLFVSVLLFFLNLLRGHTK